MDLFETSWHLSDLISLGGPVYFRTDPEVPDFTTKATCKVLIQSIKKQVEFILTPEDVVKVLGIFQATVFDRDVVPILFTWNIKAFLSYCRAFVSKLPPITTSLVDLNVIENFLNISKTRPENCVEAVNRGKIVSGYKNWKAIYKALHLPLMLQVLPVLETTPLLNDECRKSQYAYYEIEGQSNGRINCLKKYHEGYLPYTLSDEQKEVMRPRGYGYKFFSADYRACEVYVLQWLSQDQQLAEVIKKGVDLHAGIYEVITGDVCNSDRKRDISKGVFLPVMYGSGVNGIVKGTGISENVAAEVISRIYKKFPQACDWMKQKQAFSQENGFSEDYFGRRRELTKDQSYLARNFAVQGVAATFCQEKLVTLIKAISEVDDAHLCYSVHDGYIGACKPESGKKVYDVVKQTLESPSKLCPGLVVRVKVKFGGRLCNLKELWTH